MCKTAYWVSGEVYVAFLALAAFISEPHYHAE